MRQRLAILDSLAYAGRRFRQPQRLAGVHAQFAAYDFGESRHHARVEQVDMLAEECVASRFVGKLCQCREKRLQRRVWLGARAHSKPAFSRLPRSLLRHRPRMNPIDPVATPRLWATSE